jgi:Ca2+-binding RTX toxin-like protein
VGTGEGEFNPNDIGSDILEGVDGDDSMFVDGKYKTPNGGTGTDTWQAGCTMTQGVDWDGDNVDIEQIYTDGTQTLEPTKRANDYQPRHVSGDGDTASTIKFRVIERGRGGPFPATGPHVYNDIVDSRGWVDDDVDGVEVMTGGGNDQVIGSDTGKDIIFGGNGNDKLAGLGQQDFLSAGEGDDTISGGAAGDDIFGGDEDPTVTDTDVDGEDLLTYGPVSVTDRLDVPGSSEAVTVSLEGRLDWYLWNSDKNENPPDGGADFGRGGDAQGDIIRDKDGKNTNGNKSRDGGASDSSIEDLTGSESGDWLAADQTDNVVKGGGGDDMLFGLGADDEIRGGDGKDDIYGDRNPRQVKGWPSGATGAAGNDELWGDKGDDNIHGDDGQDKLLGGDGDDSLVGGLGEDGTTGGKGDDVMKLEFEDEAANYDITDFNGFYGAFGDEGMDTFQIDFVPDSLDNAENRLNARVELALADIDGITDFDVNQDQVAFA